MTTLRGQPIPDLGDKRLAKIGARDWPIDTDAESFNESMMRVEAFRLVGRNHYAHDRNPPYWRVIDGAVDALWLRKTVCEKLARIDARLRMHGLRLHIYDGWRPTAVQAYFHDTWMVEELTARRPDLKGEALLDTAIQEHVLMQIENLQTHPCVAAKLQRNQLTLHAWSRQGGLERTAPCKVRLQRPGI